MIISGIYLFLNLKNMKLNKKIFLGKKKLSVDKFLNKVLYNKTYGYYSQKIIWSKWDFITSPNISFCLMKLLLYGLYTMGKTKNEKNKFNWIEPWNGSMSLTILKTLKDS